MPANMPIVGTTATANDRVIDDAKRQLGELSVQRGALMRESLHLQTLRLPTQAERLAWLAEHIDELPGTGIIYALTQRDAEQVSAWLNQRGVSSDRTTQVSFTNATRIRPHTDKGWSKPSTATR